MIPEGASAGLRRQIGRVLNKCCDLPNLIVLQNTVPTRHAREPNSVLDDPEQMRIRIVRNLIDDLRNRWIKLSAHWADPLQGSAVAESAISFVSASALDKILRSRSDWVFLIRRIALDVLVHRHVRQ